MRPPAPSSPGASPWECQSDRARSTSLRLRRSFSRCSRPRKAALVDILKSHCPRLSKLCKVPRHLLLSRCACDDGPRAVPPHLSSASSPGHLPLLALRTLGPCAQRKSEPFAACSCQPRRGLCEAAGSLAAPRETHSVSGRKAMPCHPVGASDSGSQPQASPAARSSAVPNGYIAVG
jgi:hypothetical protein